MSVTRTFTVTVVSTGSGNKYFIDGVQQPTLELVEGGTFRFDVSDSSMGPHPFKFSTTSGGTHSGGSEYTTGVTESGTTGQSGAYVQIVVADSAPTLYYYCQYHSGMGGQANTPNTDFWGAGNWSANLWGISEAFATGWGAQSWNDGQWGELGDATVFPTGLSITSSVGDGTNMGVPLTGFGGSTWNSGEWGQVNDNSAVLTGFGLTTSLNSDGLLSFQSNGWGRNTWNSEPWGESNNPVVNISGFGLTSAVGDGTNMGVPQQGWGGKAWNSGEWGEIPDNSVEVSGLSMTASVGSLEAYNEIGWGRDGWGEEGYGRANDAAVSLTGFELESNSGISTWGAKGWGNNSWGLFALDDVASVMGLTGTSATSSVGDPTIVGDVSLTLTGQSTTASVGAASSIVGVAVQLTGQSITVSIGDTTELSSPDVDLTGVSSTISLGNISVNSNPIIVLSGQSSTSSVGSIDPTDLTLGITGQSATSSVGTGLSISSTFDITLTGQQATVSVAAFGTASGFGIQAYSEVDTGSNTSYTDVATGSNTSYSDAAQEIKIMASTFTPLGVELQATGENAGTWGTKTNTNLSLIEQISGGFTQQSIAGGADTTALAVTDGGTGAVLAHRMIEFTGTITGNQVVTIPLDVQQFYFLRNSTSGAYTVQFKYTSGSGDSFTFSATDKGDQLIFAAADDGTNPNIKTLAFGSGDGDVTLTGTQTLTNKTLTSPKVGTSVLDTNGNQLALLTATGSAVNEVTLANAATGNNPSLTASGDDTNIGIDLKTKGTGIIKAEDSGGTVSAVKIAGKETIWIPAIAMYPNTTSGAEAAQVELSNGPEIKTLDFDKTSDEFAQFAVAFPKSWNAGTVTFQAFFTATSTNTGTTAWGLSAVALADSGDLNTAFGTQVVATAKAHSGTSNDLDVSAESGVVTIAGSPGADEYVFFQVSRDVSADDLDADARLLGIKLHFTTSAANDA